MMYFFCERIIGSCFPSDHRPHTELVNAITAINCTRCPWVVDARELRVEKLRGGMSPIELQLISP